MGNRAVITTKENFANDGVGVYLHWNGGRDSVEAFLEYCDLKGYRSPTQDCYGWARLCQVIANFFGGTTSVGIDKVNHLDCDNNDNGVYIIEGWRIVDRKYFKGLEQSSHERIEFLKAIDEGQPVEEQLSEDFFDARIIPTTELEVGDTVFVREGYDGKWDKCTVIGFGEEGMKVNGVNVSGKPYVNLYTYNSFEGNINNYIQEETVRLLRK